jgi:hypothetical protein
MLVSMFGVVSSVREETHACGSRRASGVWRRWTSPPWTARLDQPNNDPKFVAAIMSRQHMADSGEQNPNASRDRPKLLPADRR